MAGQSHLVRLHRRLIGELAPANKVHRRWCFVRHGRGVPQEYIVGDRQLTRDRCHQFGRNLIQPRRLHIKGNSLAGVQHVGPTAANWPEVRNNNRFCRL